MDPFFTALNSIGPALLAGNAIVLKHENAPSVGELFQRIFNCMGIINGLCQHLSIDIPTSNRDVLESSIDHIVFTGSVAGEETFGPVLPVVVVADDDEALIMINHPLFGLTTSVFTHHPALQERMLEEARSGTVYFNWCNDVQPEVAWNGWGRSGNGMAAMSGLSRQPERPGFGHLPEPGDLVGVVVIRTVLNVVLGRDISAGSMGSMHRPGTGHRPSTPPSQTMNLTDQLAKERNRAAAERTLMAWIRTCLALISFGFGLDKIIAAINASNLQNQGHAQLSVRLVAVAFVLTGILAMMAATAQHRKILRRLRSDDFVYREEPSIALATAVLIALIGILALVLLLAGALAA